MRFRLTIFLLLANFALFFAIWKLDMSVSPQDTLVSDAISFTRLEIHGKNIGKPRVLSLDNNKWRIISPIDWTANAYAVNRIRTQLEFLSKETSFDLSEIKKYGHTLEEYGLKEPLFLLKYGTSQKMNTVRVGGAAAIGNRMYMFDEGEGKIIVVDKEFVEGLILDIERLRNQSVFDIPRFEVASFSIRLPQGADNSEQGNFKRIGLVKEGGKWKFETPVNVSADGREVEAFLNDICQLSAKSFESEGASFPLIPTTITIQGTNRRRVLMLGSASKDGELVYAKLEDNPTIFTLEASKFKNLASIQNTLRDKSFLRVSPSDIDSIDISKDGKILKLRKLTGGVWDVIGAGKNGETLTSKADLGRVNLLLSKIGTLRARDFVSDIPIESPEKYGFGAGALKIVLTRSDQTSQTVTVGSHYMRKGAVSAYARTDDGASVYGISRELENSAHTDFLYYRSRILEAVSEKAKIVSMKIFDAKTSAVVFELSAIGGDMGAAFAKLSPREAKAAKTLADYSRVFEVAAYIPEGFSKNGVTLSDKKNEPWTLRIETEYELPSAGGAQSAKMSFVWFVAKPEGGTTQLGGSEKNDAVFKLAPELSDALRELTIERRQPSELDTPAPKPADVADMRRSKKLLRTEESAVGKKPLEKGGEKASDGAQDAKTVSAQNVQKTARPTVPSQKLVPQKK